MAAMASSKQSRNPWIFSMDKLKNSPSFQSGVDNDKELHYRQQAANFIQDMGQKLQVNQLCINTAIVYMHRFYMIHSFKEHHRFDIAPACLFLAAKVEEQPKKLENVLKVCQNCLHPQKGDLRADTPAYARKAQELIRNELVVLEAIDFDVSVDHPHTHVVKCTQLIKASREFAQMAYFMATNSLHLTPFGVLYGPTVVAAMCIYLSCKWSNYETLMSSDGRPFWEYMDDRITEELLNEITGEFIKILSKYPTRLHKLRNYRPNVNNGSGGDNSGQAAVMSASASSSRQSGQKRPAEPASASRDVKQETGSRLSATAPPIAETPKKSALSLDEYSKRKMHPASAGSAQKSHGGVRPSTSGTMAPGQSSRCRLAPVKSEKSQAVPPMPSHADPHPRLQGEAFQSSRHSSDRQQQVHARLHPDPSVHKQQVQGARKPNNADHHRAKDYSGFDSKAMTEMYRREPEKLRKFLKYTLPHSRPLTRDEQAMLQKLEKREEERRKKRHMQGQQQPSMPSSAPAPLKIKLPVAPATYDASSHQSRKRGLDTSGMMEPSHKYSKRGDESAQMSKNHAQVPPTNISHRSSHHKHPSSSRSLEGGERKVQKSDY